MSKNTDGGTEKTETAKTETTTKAKKTKKATVTPRVYCGPSVKGVVKQYTFYSATLPPVVESFMEKYPLAKSLMVSAKDFPTIRAKLEKKGTPEEIIYRKLKEQIGGKK